LIGVAVSGIEGGTPAQLPLFRSAQSRRRAALNQALDILVARFGRTVIGRGTVRRGRR